jgi:primosomal protein N' (replication factor Y)
MTENIWSIAVDAPLKGALCYLSPKNLQIRRGMYVEVPLGKRKAMGLVLRPGNPVEGIELKEIESIKTDLIELPEHFITWLEWLSSYYIHPIGSVTSLVFPPLKKAEKERKSKKAPVVPILDKTTPPQLTVEQKQVFEKIKEFSAYFCHLIFGVTGSGKTEVYLRLLEEVLSKGKAGLVLVPEISLTPQLINRFSSRFGDQIAVIHSQLTDREKTNQWWDVVEGRKKILIGARSALFCPISNLGLIIVDEEHEPSYKQDEKLKYHGRDSAIMLAQKANCPIVLGSATPSLETWKNAQEGKYHLHEMKNRVENRSLPEIKILNLRGLSEKGLWLHPELHEAIAHTLQKKEQVALFLNRRGVANMLACPACGFVFECPNCDISLTLHGKNHLVCHYCDYHQPSKDICPSCKEGEMTSYGIGTEQVEAEMKKLFPDAVVARADRDEVQNRTDLEDLIYKVEKKEIDILIGTQMIAKGLDFPELTLVGLVLADIGFNIPDFRSSERSFQLITQVSGRSGRHKLGQVFIQTLNPDHVSLQFALHADYAGFATQELASRMQLNYPPFGRLACFRIQGIHLSKVQTVARELAKRAEKLKNLNTNYTDLEVLGPAEASISKLRGQFRYQLLIKGISHKTINSFIQQLLGDEEWVLPAVRISVDVDPLHLL